MRKIYVSMFLMGAILVFSYCSSSRKASAPVAARPAAKVNYQDNVMLVIQANCAPCHFPDKGGNKKPLNSYASVLANSDEILRRIQLNTTDRGFMPFRKPKISDTAINVIKQWKADGFTEK